MGPSDSKVDKVLALHMADSTLIPGTLYDFLIIHSIIIDPWAQCKD